MGEQCSGKGTVHKRGEEKRETMKGKACWGSELKGKGERAGRQSLSLNGDAKSRHVRGKKDLNEGVCGKKRERQERSPGKGRLKEKNTLRTMQGERIREKQSS